MNAPTSALATALLLLNIGCSSPTPDRPPARDDSVSADRIVLTHSPSGDLEGDDVRTVEITDPATVERWSTTLDQVPASPARGVRMITFAPGTPETRVELFADDRLSDVRRLKGGLLDVASHEGWAFYSGEDNAFTALVAAALR